MNKLIFFFLLSAITMSACTEYKDLLHKHNLNEGLIGIELTDGRVGFENELGKLVIPFDFYKAGPAWDNENEYNIDVEFNEGLSPVCNKNGLSGYINKEGEWVIPPQYAVTQHFFEGTARVLLNESKNYKTAYINHKNEFVYGPFDTENYSYFQFYFKENHGIFQSKKDNLWGIVGQDGTEKVPPIYRSIDNISEQRAFVKDYESSKLIDMEGNVILDDVGGRFFIFGTSIVATSIENETYFGIIDVNGKFLLPYTNEIHIPLDVPCDIHLLPTPQSDCEFASLHPVVDGVVPALDPATFRYGLYSIAGKWIVKPEYLTIQYVDKGVYLYRTEDKKIGYMNSNGEIIEYKNRNY